MAAAGCSAPSRRSRTACIGSLASIRAEEQSWVDYALALLWFHLAGIVALYVLLRLQHAAAAQSAAVRRHVARSGAEHRRQLRHQHELAVLWRRNDDSAIWRRWRVSSCSRSFGRNRYCRGDRAGARLHAPFVAQTIGNFWVDLTRITLYVLLPICVVAALFLVWQGVPQTFGRICHATTLEGAQSGSGARAGRIAGGDQAAQRRRRRLLQCQLGASVRKPHCLDRRCRDAADLPDRRGADQHVRPHGRRPASWLGACSPPWR